MQPKRLLITDLDNTLYDWVTFFAKSFAAMVRELDAILLVGEEHLLLEFKRVHQAYGTSEQPFALFDLPSVRATFPGATAPELRAELRPALTAFNSTRDQELVLYPGVRESLDVLV
jgi:FMN phosphatase YigB (HAD superfamily)